MNSTNPCETSAEDPGAHDLSRYHYTVYSYSYSCKLKVDPYCEKIVGVIVLASFELAWQRSTLDETPSG